MATVTARSL